MVRVSGVGCSLLFFLSLGCEHEEAYSVEQFLGDWELRGGDKEQDCGSGVITTKYVDVHVIRFVEGSEADLTLQFFEGRDASGPVVCEFEFDMMEAHAELAKEHSCSDGSVVTTWHSSVVSWGSGSGQLTITTHLSDDKGCTGVLRPFYFRAR